MASRKEYTCTLCHKPAVLPPPEYSHAINDRLGCRECHTSSEVGNMPIDHALRADSTCLLCHDIKRDAGPIPSPAAPSPSPAGG